MVKSLGSENSAIPGPICQRVPLLGSCGDGPPVTECYGEATHAGLWTWPLRSQFSDLADFVAIFGLSRFCAEKFGDRGLRGSWADLRAGTLVGKLR